MEGRAYRSSLPSASGLGLLGLGGSAFAGRLVCLCLSPFPVVLAAFAAVSSEAFRETVGRSRDPFLDVLPTTWGPTILIRAIVSGEGERRKPSAVSRIGDEGAEEVNGSEDRLSGSGRLNGAGAGSACVICGTGGRRWFEMGTSLIVSFDLNHTRWDSLLLTSNCHQPPRSDNWEIRLDGFLILLVDTSSSTLIIPSNDRCGSDKVCGVECDFW